MVPTERGKSEEKTLSAMQFKKAFKKDPSFLVSIRELTRKEIAENYQAKSLREYKLSLTNSST